MSQFNDIGGWTNLETKVIMFHLGHLRETKYLIEEAEGDNLLLSKMFKVYIRVAMAKDMELGLLKKDDIDKRLNKIDWMQIANHFIICDYD